MLFILTYYMSLGLPSTFPQTLHLAYCLGILGTPNSLVEHLKESKFCSSLISVSGCVFVQFLFWFGDWTKKKTGSGLVTRPKLETNGSMADTPLTPSWSGSSKDSQCSLLVEPRSSCLSQLRDSCLNVFLIPIDRSCLLSRVQTQDRPLPTSSQFLF